MKRIFLCIAFALLSTLAFAQYQAYFDNEKYYIRYETGNYLPETPVMMIKTFKGDVIKLEGQNQGSKTGGAIAIGNTGVSAAISYQSAEFQILPTDVEKLSDGISKIRINTYPKVFEKTYKTDKLGKKLLKMFEKSKKKQQELGEF